MPSGISRSGSKWSLGKVPHTGGMIGYRIDGIENVTAGINRALRKMKIQGHAGLLSAANYVLTDADIGQAPLVPHDTGNLRGSRFAEPFTSPKGDPFVVLGYDANYAAAVHEMITAPSGKPINWQRPGSGPKFLQASLFRNAAKIPRIVAKHMTL